MEELPLLDLPATAEIVLVSDRTSFMKAYDHFVTNLSYLDNLEKELSQIHEVKEHEKFKHLKKFKPHLFDEEYQKSLKTNLSTMKDIQDSLVLNINPYLEILFEEKKEKVKVILTPILDLIEILQQQLNSETELIPNVQQKIMSCPRINRAFWGEFSQIYYAEMPIFEKIREYLTHDGVHFILEEENRYTISKVFASFSMALKYLKENASAQLLIDHKSYLIQLTTYMRGVILVLIGELKSGELAKFKHHDFRGLQAFIGQKGNTFTVGIFD